MFARSANDGNGAKMDSAGRVLIQVGLVFRRSLSLNGEMRPDNSYEIVFIHRGSQQGARLLGVSSGGYQQQPANCVVLTASAVPPFIGANEDRQASDYTNRPGKTSGSSD
jgi:hypothetical protein